MSTEFFNDQWRIPSNENQNKVSNYSMEFDGTNDKIEFGDVNNFERTNSFSGSCWVFYEGVTGASQYIISKFNSSNNKGYQFYLNSIGSLNFIIGPGPGGAVMQVAVGVPQANTWNHLVFTYDGSSLRTGINIYINGVIQTPFYAGASSITGTIKDASIPFQISGRSGTSANGVNGKIDQVTIFDYELSQDQVTQLGAEGYTFDFNGSTQAIDCGAGSKFNIDQITISGWVKLDSSITSTLVIAGCRNTNNGIACYQLQNSGTRSKFRFVIGQEDGTYVDAVADDIHQYNTWYHVVGVADGSNVKMYVNGVLQTDQATYDGTIASPTQNFNIGRQPSNPLYYWDGELSNISVFNTGLSSTDVQTLYNSGKPLADMSSFTSLQGWWKLDETATFNSGTSVWSIPDASSNSNTGTSVGMDASNLVASNINGELITNPMITSPKPIAYYQLGDQSVDNGANYLVPNNSLSGYDFKFVKNNSSYTSGDSINIPGINKALAGATSMSMTFWVYLTPAVGNNGMIFRMNAGSGYIQLRFFRYGNARGPVWMFHMSDGTNYSGPSGNTSTASRPNFYNSDFLPSPAGSNMWWNITCTWDGSNVKVYRNGSTQPSRWGTYTGIIPSDANATAFLGANVPGSSTGLFTNGRISNVAFWRNYSLTQSEAKEVYNNGAPLDLNNFSGSAPAAWYKLNASEIFNSKWSVDNNAYPSVYQSSLNFNGSSNYIDCGDSDDLSFGNGSTDSPFSISAWIYMNDTTTFRIVSKAGTNGNEYFLSNGGDDKLNFILYDTLGSGNIRAKYDTALTSYEGQWIHIVGTYSGVNRQNGIELYLNGSLLTTLKVLNSPYTAMSNSTQPLEIGRSASSSYANGTFSNVSVFNIELSSPQVATLYNNGTPEASISHSPVSWWKLDNTTTGLIDNGSASNNGTNNGATEYAGFVNSLAGESVGMGSSNLVVSDLQQTSGYSPYALDFDGVDDYLDCGNDSSLQITGAMTISYWVKGTSTLGAAGVGTLETVSSPGYILGPTTTGVISFNIGLTSSSLFSVATTQQITTTEWHHIVGVYTPSVSMKIYIDGQLSKTVTSNIPSSQYAAGNDFKIGYRPCCKIDGQISNVAVWNTDLSSSEINEIYNEGVPGNLHNFSGTAPVSWWQIGSNSSYNSGAWTCLDEIGSNNAVSAGSMTNSDIVDGPGYSASGLGTSSIDIKGDAPYSTANGLSENMDVLDRVTDVPS